MTKRLKIARLVLVLLTFIAVLIGLPAWLFGIAGDVKVWFLMVGYFVFFLGTVWRVVWHGQLARREDDEQVRTPSGLISSVLSIIGLVAFHWISLYTYSLHDRMMGEYTALAHANLMLSISLVLSSIIVSQLAIRTLGKFFDRLTIKTDHRLVTEGIYGFVRHPIYTSYILLFLGFCTMLQSFWGLMILILTCLIWFGKRIAIEEQMLEDKFGDEYRVYCQHSQRLFPYLF
ncbi:MAG: isoprenylcysteine carboxylmethyltransferase family protein [Pseudomonadota bacterium]